MSFTTGSASSFADLLVQVKAELLTAGFTNPSGNLMHHSGSYWRLEADGTSYFRLMPFANAAQSDYPTDGSYMVGGASGVQFPCAFNLYIDTSPVPEVFISVNYSELYYQWIAFGKSAVVLPGTGTWCSGSFNDTAYRNCYMNAYSNTVGGYRASYGTSHLPFCANYVNTGNSGEFIHHGFTDGDYAWSRVNLDRAAQSPAIMLRYTPLPYSNEVPLIPVVAMLGRSKYDSGRAVPVLECQNIRLFMFDTGTRIVPGQQLTLGDDVWDLLPAHKLNRASQYAAFGVNDSGCFGIAVRRT